MEGEARAEGGGARGVAGETLSVERRGWSAARRDFVITLLSQISILYPQLSYLYLCFERLMTAVLGPGLGENLEFDVGGVAALISIVILDRLHLRQVKGSARRSRERASSPASS